MTHAPQHGTINEYTNRGCGCDNCNKAISNYRRQSRINNGLNIEVDNGTIPQRIEFLKSMGLRSGTIAKLWGVSQTTVNNHSRPHRIRLSRAEKFLTAWDDMKQVAGIAHRHGMKI